MANGERWYTSHTRTEKNDVQSIAMFEAVLYQVYESSFPSGCFSFTQQVQQAKTTIINSRREEERLVILIFHT